MGPRKKAGLSLLLMAAMALLLPLISGYGNSPTTPDSPPTQYQHSLKIEAKTLHFGEAVTGAFTVKMLTNNKEFAGNIGETVILDATKKREETCDVLINGTGCLPREFQNIGVSNNVLSTDVVKLADIDMDYLLTEVLTKKDSQGRGLNTGWRPTFMNGSSNPDGTTGLSLDLAYISGFDYGPPLGIKGILPALLDFQAWGKRYAGTPFEELYISSFTFNNQGSYVYDTTPPPDGDFRVFRKSDSSGATIKNFPLTEVKVMSSIERVNPSSADPLDAYR